MSATLITQIQTHPLMVRRDLSHGAAPYRAIAIPMEPVGPSTPFVPSIPPHVVGPSGPDPLGGSAPQSSVLSPQPCEDRRPSIELIYDHGQFAALLIPRELTQAQLLIAEHLRKDSWRLRIDIALHWQQWRAYASPCWLPTIEVLQVPKMTGPKLFFV